MAIAYNRDSGSTGAAALRDIYLRHGINLTRYSTHEARKLIDILDTANVQIRGIIKKAKGIETKKKYRRVAKEIRRVSDELGGG
jgi:recombinational DNA repair protein (RecF pathway)